MVRNVGTGPSTCCWPKDAALKCWPIAAPCTRVAHTLVRPATDRVPSIAAVCFANAAKRKRRETYSEHIGTLFFFFLAPFCVCVGSPQGLGYLREPATTPAGHLCGVIAAPSRSFTKAAARLVVAQQTAVPFAAARHAHRVPPRAGPRRSCLGFPAAAAARARTTLHFALCPFESETTVL